MSKLQQLLDEKFPKSEISHIQRAAFEDGYKEAIKLGKEVADQIVYAEKMADSCGGMIDDPHVRAVRVSSKKASEFLEANK